MTRLLAISDLHVGDRRNRELVDALPGDGDAWLIVAGDVAERVADVVGTLASLRERFGEVVWVPGNHELWTMPFDTVQARGEERYLLLVESLRAVGVKTPEDEYAAVECDGEELFVVPMFLLYDYSFGRPGVPRAELLREAARAGTTCADEHFLGHEPYADRAAWCRARVESTRARCDRLPLTHRTVLISHFPLRRDVVDLPSLPGFELWCGTTLTDDWHRRYRAAVVVSGHLHRPRTSWRDGVRFEEVSLGYHREWRRRPAVGLRQVLPAPVEVPIPHERGRGALTRGAT